MERAFAALIAIVGWFALLLQLILFITSPNIFFPENVIRFFSYFTILANIFVSLTVTSGVFLRRTYLGQIYSSASVMAAAAVMITIVGGVYSLFLRSVWNPLGWQAVADHLLHDVVPLAYIIFWLIYAPKGGLIWKDPLRWLLFPATYIGYSLIRGAVTNWYPYWFVDVTQLGYPVALTNTGFVLVAFLVIGFLYFAVAKLLSRTAIESSS